MFSSNAFPSSPTNQLSSPLNVETPISSLLAPITSVSSAYHRNHGPIPRLEAATHTIKIQDTTSPCLLFDSSQTLSIADLESLEQTNLTAALQCAGNRRHTMSSLVGASTGKKPQGIDWHAGAVMNASWSGVRLTTLIAHLLGRPMSELSVKDLQGKHIAFSSHAVACEEDSYYGSSLPLGLALDPQRDVLLATHQNGQRLTAEHGFPVRVVVPGIAGARSVKWLDEIVIQDSESSNFYMQRDYKILPPGITDGKQATDDIWASVGPLMEMPVNSVIVAVQGLSESEDGHGGDDIVNVALDGEGYVKVEGYALPSGDGGPVVQVEVRVDQGGWEEAEILPHEAEDDSARGKWAWTLWRARVRIGVENKGRHRIWSRAKDKAGNAQQEETSAFNLRGVAYNGYGVINIEVE